MKKGLLVFILLFLFATPIVSALVVNAEVKTDYPFRFLLVRVLDSDNSVVDSISPGKTDIKGDKEINFSTSLKEVGFEIYIIEDGATLQEMFFEAQSVNDPFVLDMRENPVEEEIVEEEIIEEEITEEEVVEEEEEVIDNEDAVEISALAGNVISDDEGFDLSNFFYYIIGFVVLLAIFGFIAGMVINSKKRVKMGLPKHKLVPNFNKKHDFGDRELADAESKIREAQAEINRIKNKDKVNEAEERY